MGKKGVVLIVIALSILLSSSAYAAIANHQFTSAGWITFGQVVPQGVAKDGLQLGNLPTQTDVKVKWPDGSIRFAVVTAKIPSAGTYELKSSSLNSGTFTPSTPSASVQFTGGITNTVDLPNTVSNDLWLNGPLVKEWRSVVNANSFVRVIYDTRVYNDGQAKVDVTVENVLDKAETNAVTYNVNIAVNGQNAFSKTNVSHWTFTRWRKTFNVGLTASQIKPDFEPVFQAKALPRYMTHISNDIWSPGGAAFDILGKGAITYEDMAASGGRSEIAPYPDWTARYLVHKNPTQRQLVLAQGDLGGSWPIHIREADGRFVSIDERPKFWFDPRGDDKPKGTWNPGPLRPDNAHQPSLAYVPYLISGDRYYKDEMQFWANYCLVGTWPAEGFQDSREGSKGILVQNQIRGFGWYLRNLGDAATYTPDSDQLKNYFMNKASNNLAWLDNYANTFNGGPFEILWPDRRPENTNRPPYVWIGTWEQEYLAWAVDHLIDQGFSQGKVYRDRFARLIIRLFNSEPDFPRSKAAPYVLQVGTRSNGVISWYSMAQMAAGTDAIGFTGAYGPEARLMLMIGIRNSMPGAQSGYDWLMAWTQPNADPSNQYYNLMNDMARRAGWAIALDNATSAPPTAQCGNGIVEGSEQCDDANSNNNDACKNDCTNNVCGDGVIRTNVEACDSGSSNGICPSACSSACNLNSCQPLAGTTFSASADFSNTQGTKNWNYLDSKGASMTFDSANNRWKGTETYNLIWSDGGHPGYNADSVRRWTAPQSGNIKITGKAYDGHAGCGEDGVKVYIKKGSQILWQQNIAKDDKIGIDFDLGTNVNSEDAIDFGINMLTASGCDSTYFNPTITLSSQATPVQTIQGDLNTDSKVDILDVLVIVNDFGKTAGFNPAADVAAPFGLIDIFDVMVVVRNWGKTSEDDTAPTPTPPAPAPTPTPLPPPSDRRPAETTTTISPGIYKMSDVIKSSGTPQQWIRYKPQVPGAVMLRGGALQNVQYVILDGFIVNGSFHESPGKFSGISVQTSNVRIEGTEVVGPADIHEGYSVAGTLSCSESDGHPGGGGIGIAKGFENVTFSNITVHGFYDAGAISGRNVKIENSLFRNNFNGLSFSGEGIDIVGSVFWQHPNHLFSMQGAGLVRFVNNLFAVSQDGVQAGPNWVAGAKEVHYIHNTYYLPANDPCNKGGGVNAYNIFGKLIMKDNVFVKKGAGYLNTRFVEDTVPKEFISDYNLGYGSDANIGEEFSYPVYFKNTNSISFDYKPRSHAQWTTLTGQDKNSIFHKKPLFADAPVYTIPLPSPGNEANQWGFRIPKTTAEARSWFELLDGSPGKSSASDGLDQGIVNPSLYAAPPMPALPPKSSDVTPPAGRDFSATGINPFGATLSWKTSEPANSYAHVCTEVSACNNRYFSSAKLATSHSVTISDIYPNKTYYAWIIMEDAAGNIGDYSSGTRFLTTPTPSPIALPASGQDSHAYFNSLISRPDHWKSYSLRPQAGAPITSPHYENQLLRRNQGGYAQCNSCSLDVTYNPANDPDPRRQDAAKIVVPADRVSLPNNPLLPIPNWSGHSLFVTWDAWFGQEFMFNNTGISNYKNFQFASGRIWTEVRSRFALGQHQYIPPALALVDVRQYGGIGPGTIRPPGYPPSDPGKYGGGAIGPMIAEFAVQPETWTRYWVLFKPTGGTFQATFQSELRTYPAYEFSLWVADENNNPVLLIDRVIIGPNMPGWDFWNSFWLEYNTSTNEIPPGRGALVGYVRNIAMLRDPANVTSLLQRPVK